MSLPRWSVLRPVTSVMVALIVVVIGLVSTSQLRTDLLPAVEIPTLTVDTRYHGADPDVVERLITRMVEEIIATVPGIEDLQSTSSEGFSRLRVTFGWDTDIDVAASDVRARLEQELSELPEEVQRPQLRKFDVSSIPVVVLGIASDTLDPVELNDVAEDIIRQRFARLPGVAQVDLWGGYSREIRIALRPQRLIAHGIDPLAVQQAIQDANIDAPVGRQYRGRTEMTLRSPNEFLSLDELASVPVQRHDGGIVYLRDIAYITDNHGEINRTIRVNDQRGIRIAIRKEADANTVEVAEHILAEIDRTNRDLAQVEVVAVINQGSFIRRSIDNVAQSVVLGGMLALVILVFFLRNIRSTAVIGLAIPLAILATMSLMFFFGLTLNLMTLGGLALGVGMMVDNSIVVLENIFRRRQEHHDNATESAITGSNEVASAIIASTITTLVIFLPLVFIEGVTGVLFGELALVVALSLGASLLIALTLVPMLASRLIGGNSASGAKGISAVKQPEKETAKRSPSLLTSLEHSYLSLLQQSQRHPWLTVIFSFMIFTASLFLVPRLGSEFFTPSDEGEITVSAEFESGLRLDIADTQTDKLAAMVQQAAPEITHFVTAVSASGREVTPPPVPGLISTSVQRISVKPIMIRLPNVFATPSTGRSPGQKSVYEPKKANLSSIACSITVVV